MAAPARRFRVAGSKFTTFKWRGDTLLLCNQLSHTSPQPVAQPVAIQPIGAAHPLEIITTGATGMGALQLEVFEVYGRKVWDDLQGLTGANDLVEIFNRVADTATPIEIVKYVIPPGGSGVGQYSESYRNCVIANVEDGEVINVGQMQITKNITVNYTDSVR